MANAFSLQANFGEYISPVNTELVNFVLNSKQQKYDYNVAKIDDTIAEFGMDLERDSDKDYVLQKLNGVLESVNSMGKMDLSNGNITRDLQQQIRGALDSNMIQMAVSTKNYRGFINNLQKIKEKNPEQYSDINAAFAMERGGVEAWLNNERDTLGAVSYTPYQDVNGKVVKGIKDLKEFNPERTLDIPFTDSEGVRRIISKKVKDLNEAEIRSYVMTNLDSNSQNQLMINGWATFRGANDEQLKGYTETYRKTKIGNYDTNIGLLREQLKNAPSYQVQDIKDRISVLTSEKNSFTSTMDSVGNDRDNIGRIIMQEQLVDNASRAYADTNISYELKNDTAYYENAKLEFEKVKAATAAAKSQKGSQFLGGNNQVRAIDTPVIDPEGFDPNLETDNIIAQEETKVSSAAQMVIDQMDPETKNIFKSLRENEKYSGGMTDAELLNKLNLNLTYTDENGRERLFKDDMYRLQDVYEDATESHRETMDEAFDLNLDGIYSEITSEGWANNNEFPLIQEDGSIAQMDTFLKSNGITLEDFKANVGGIKQKVKKSLYLNKALGEITKNVVPNVNSSGPLYGSRTQANSDNMYMMDFSSFDSANSYIKSLNPNDDIFKYFEFRDVNGNEITQREAQKLEQKPVKLLPRSEQARGMLRFIKDNDNIFTDASVTSEGGLNEMLSFDTERFNLKLKENFAARSGNSLVIDPNLGKGGKELSDPFVRMRNFVTSKGDVDINDKKPFIVSQDLSNRNEVIIYQNDEDNTQIKVSRQELEQFMGMPLLDSNGERHVINKEVINRDISPLNIDKAEHQKKFRILSSMVENKEIYGGIELSKKGLSSNIKLLPGYSLDGEKTQAGQLADTVILNDFSNLSIAYRPSGSGGYVTVMDKNSQDEIISYPIEREEVPIIRNTVRHNPQLFIARSLQNMLESFNEEGVNSELFNKLLQSQNATK